MGIIKIIIGFILYAMLFVGGMFLVTILIVSPFYFFFINPDYVTLEKMGYKRADIDAFTHKTGYSVSDLVKSDVVKEQFDSFIKRRIQRIAVHTNSDYRTVTYKCACGKTVTNTGKPEHGILICQCSCGYKAYYHVS